MADAPKRAVAPHAFMEQYIRDRAVAPIKPGSPGLEPQDRRSWWEFSLWMAEFLGNVIRDRKVNRESAHQFSRLQWICIRATYVFATPDPALWAEQRRYVELCGCLAVAFAVIVDDPEGIRDLCALVFAMDRSKEPAIDEAIVGEAWLRWWKTWEHAISPLAWVRDVAEHIHREHCPLAMDQVPASCPDGYPPRRPLSLDRLTPTGDPYAALLPDLAANGYAEIDAIVDLDMACEWEGLNPATSLLARGRYNGVPLSVATEVLGLSKQDLVAACQELRTAMPALQARLAPYQGKTKPQVKQI